MAGLAILIWRLMDVVLLVFGGIILAVALVSLSRLVRRHIPLEHRASLALVFCLLVIAILAAGALTGARLAEQFGQLAETLGTTWAHIRHERPLGAALVTDPRSVPVQSVSHVVALAATGLAGIVTGGLLIVFVGLFLAADPPLYRNGLLRLVPRSAQERTLRVLDALGVGLGNWLLGVLVSMLCVGTFTALGLWALRIPLALSLGLLAGLLEFIPYVGPIVSAVPAILVAFSVGPWQALEVAGLFLVVHGLEAYVLVPMIQRWAVALPPALGIVAVITFGLLFGPIGVILAHPLMVCAMILVRELYLERDVRVD